MRLGGRRRGDRDRALRRRRHSRATRCSSGSSATRRGQVTVYGINDCKSPYASGSAKVDAYVVCPCSMTTVGTLAAGAMANLIHRAASVALKERRKLVLVPRETPLSSIHLRGLATLHEAGAVILFAAPGFYHGAADDRRSRRLRRRALPRPDRHRQHARRRWGVVTHESRHARARRASQSMFDRIAPVYDVMNRVMTAGLDRRWRRLTVAGRRPARRPCSRCVLRHGRPRDRRRAARAAAVVGLDFSERDARAGAAEVAARSSGCRATCSTLPFARRSVRRRHRRLRCAQRRRSRAGARVSCGACCGPAAGSRSSRSRSRAASCGRSSRSGSTASCRCSAGCCPGGKAYTYLPASVRRFPAAEELGGVIDGVRLRGGRVPAVRRLDRGAAHGDRVVSTTVGTLELVTARRARRVPGGGRGAARALDREPSGSRRRGRRRRARRGWQAAAARCWRTSRRPEDTRAVARGRCRGRARPQATLVHDDLIDGARVRRGRAAAWTAHGADAARAAGDYLFARAFSELAQTGDRAAVEVLADACLSLARGEALQRRQRYDPDTTVDAYLERCALKTGKLFEAACVLGGGQRRLRPAARDRLPDRGRHPRLHGRHDRDREGPRHRPSRRDADAAVAPRRAGRSRRPGRRSPAGRSRACSSASAASGALERSRATALDYASRARGALDGTGRRDELEALADAVVMRTG